MMAQTCILHIKPQVPWAQRRNRNNLAPCAIRGTASPPLPYKNTGISRVKNAPLVWSSCKTPRRWADQAFSLPTPPRAWRSCTGGQLKTWATTIMEPTWNRSPDASVQPRTMGKGLGESLSLHGLLNWWCRLNPPSWKRTQVQVQFSTFWNQRSLLSVSFSIRLYTNQ